jgi:lipoic acid synthetase
LGQTTTPSPTINSSTTTSSNSNCSISITYSTTTESLKNIIPRVGGDMPEGKRPDWFRVPAPGGKGTKFDELRDAKRRKCKDEDGGKEY